jgi:hypothetical protein
MKSNPSLSVARPVALPAIAVGSVIGTGIFFFPSVSPAKWIPSGWFSSGLFGGLPLAGALSAAELGAAVPRPWRYVFLRPPRAARGFLTAGQFVIGKTGSVASIATRVLHFRLLFRRPSRQWNCG